MTSRPFSDEARQVRKLIGLELRCRVAGEQREVAIFPLDIELPMTWNYGSEFNVTVHTDAGDSTTPNTRLP